MKVLVTVASKHGSTIEIGEAIAATLTQEGHQVDLLEPSAVRDVKPYDAVILGSGVYIGHWIESAKEFADHYAMALREKPVWIFSSGPLGTKPAESPVDVTQIIRLVGPREHRVFYGALERDRLGFGERAIIGMVHAPYGDFRDWDAITEWARGISAELWHIRLEERGLVPA